MNVIFLSMGRCGVSWVGDTIKSIYERLYGKPLEIHYENDRSLISNILVKGWNGVYDVDPKELLKRGYDKILIIKRDLETMKYEHAKYHGYLEMYESYAQMQVEREGFFQRIELTYDLLYNQELNNPRILIVSLEELNNYTYSIFNEIIEFLEFKLTFIQKIKLFFRILRNKVKPFVIATKPNERNWGIYGTLLPKGQELCERLEYMKKINKKNEVKICQM